MAERSWKGFALASSIGGEDLDRDRTGAVYIIDPPRAELPRISTGPRVPGTCHATFGEWREYYVAGASLIIEGRTGRTERT